MKYFELFSIKFMIAIFAIMFLFSSCRERIDIELDSTYTRLVVDARLSLDTMAHCVKLTQTVDYFDPEAPAYVSNAIVTLECDGNLCVLQEDALRKGYYFTPSSYHGIQGKTYNLNISQVDIDQDGEFETYASQATMPNITDKIDSIKGYYGKGMPPFFDWGGDKKGWNILLYAHDPPSKEYYVFTISVNHINYDDTIRYYNQIPDDFTQGQYIRGLPLYFFRDSGEITLKAGDIVDLEARSVSRQYNQFISDVKNAVSGSTPMFGSSPANVRGNISNGSMGFFAVYANRRARLVLK